MVRTGHGQGSFRPLKVRHAPALPRRCAAGHPPAEEIASTRRTPPLSAHRGIIGAHWVNLSRHGVRGAHTFRVTERGLEVEEEDAEEPPRRSRRSSCAAVRPACASSVAQGISNHVLDLLTASGRGRAQCTGPRPLDLTGLNLIHDVDRPETQVPQVRAGHGAPDSPGQSANPRLVEAISAGVLLLRPYPRSQPQCSSSSQGCGDPR